MDQVLSLYTRFRQKMLVAFPVVTNLSEPHI